MRCSEHKLFAALLMVAACMPGMAQRTYNLGSAPPADEIPRLFALVV